MAQTMSVEQAAAKLAELVRGMAPDDEIVLTQDSRPVARIVPSPSRRRQPGSCRGMLIVRSEDDEHLQDFKEYMP